MTCPGEDCSGHGACNRKNGKCKCEKGWTLSEDCSVPECSKPCENGVCLKGSCMCAPGWRGESCDVKTCPHMCHSRGVCVNGACSCLSGYEGDACEKKSCPLDCSGDNGQCNYKTGECECNRGHAGDGCEIQSCIIGGCSGHGVCNSDTHRCECEKNFGGLGCSVGNTCTWCSSAKRENISFLIHLPLSLRVFFLVHLPLSLHCIPHSQQYHSNFTEILNSRFALEHRYCYEIQESIQSWSSVCDNVTFQYNLLKQASRSLRWRVVLAILLKYKNISSNLLESGSSILVPVPPQPIDVDSMTRFYVWWISIPTTQKLQHALRSRGFSDSLFWDHVFRVSKTSTDLRWTEEQLLRDANCWARNVCNSSTSVVKGKEVFIAGAALFSLAIFVWLRGDDRRTYFRKFES